MVSQWPTAN